MTCASAASHLQCASAASHLQCNRIHLSSRHAAGVAELETKLGSRSQDALEGTALVHCGNIQCVRSEITRRVLAGVAPTEYTGDKERRGNNRRRICSCKRVCGFFVLLIVAFLAYETYTFQLLEAEQREKQARLKKATADAQAKAAASLKNSQK